MENTDDIKDVTSFLEKIKNVLSNPNIDAYADGRGLPNRIFYRGESKDYGATSNVAKIFRDEYSEYSNMNEFMRNKVKKFKDLKDNFSKIAYMQHFGVSTRLLDVTTNPLVALYFACDTNKNSDQNGNVSIFFSNHVSHAGYAGGPNSYAMYNYDSDTLAILSTLAMMDEEKKSIIFCEIKEFNNKIDKLNDTNDTNDTVYTEWYENMVGKFQENTYNNLGPEEKSTYNAIQSHYDVINNNYEIKSLYKDLKRNLGYFDRNIDFRGLIHPFFVIPSVNNDRLKAQDGYFLFEPYDGNTMDSKQIHDDILEKISKNKDDKELRVVIPSYSKVHILKELDDTFNINKNMLFPN